MYRGDQVRGANLWYTLPMFTKLFWIQLGLLVVIAVFHACALMYEWYWHVWMLDVPVHAAAGAWVCLSVYWVLRDVVGHASLSSNEYVFLCMTVLLVGAGWEVFELYTGIIGTDTSDLLDSGKDIVMDLVGASCASLCIARRWL